MRFEQLKSGIVAFDLEKRKMGRTEVTTLAVIRVEIIEVIPERRSVKAKWNGGAPRAFGESAWRKWKLEKPILVTGGLGRKRLATKDEIAALKVQEVEEDMPSQAQERSAP